MAKKCPLCGGKLKGNYCESCGYDVPDDGDLSALYNYDPSDYPQPEQDIQPAIREITPAVQAEEIYPNKPEPPKFKVRNDEGNTVQGNFGSPNAFPKINPNPNPPPAPQNNQQQAVHDFRTGYKSRNPANPTPYINNRQTPPPVYRQTQINPNLQQMGQDYKDELKEFSKKYLWLLILSFILPFVGVILLVTMKKTIDPKFRWVVIAAIVLGIILPP